MKTVFLPPFLIALLVAAWAFTVPAAAQADVGATSAECKQQCFEAFILAAGLCDEGECKKCKVTVHGICVIWTVNTACLSACRRAAEATLRACMDACED